MKSNNLLNFLTFSEIRKKILLSLIDKPLTIDELKNIHDRDKPLSSPQIIPYIRELQHKNLLYKKGDKYQLTPLGRTIAKKFKSIVNTFDIFDNNDKYFNEHDIEPIPDHLVDRIDELGQCIIVKNSLENITAVNHSILENISRSTSIKGISAIFDVSYPKYIVSVTERKIPVSLIITQNIYDIIKNNYGDSLNRYLEYDHSELLIINNTKFAFVVTDKFMTLSLCLKDGNFDLNTILMSFEGSALQWGEELYNFYKSKSYEICDN